MKIVIGFGGNVGEVRAAFDRAAVMLESAPGIEMLARSPLFRTTAVGPRQPSFLNAAVLVESAYFPRQLLALCRDIEIAEGRDRQRETRWGPRTLDLDLLIAESVVCRGPVLELPHPRLIERAFALVPAANLCPGWVHPTDGRTLAELATTARAADPESVSEAGDRD